MFRILSSTLIKSRENSFRRILLICAFFFVPISQSIYPQILSDSDLWWHLRTGQWIVEHGTVPQTDPFSIYGQGKPWFAYSWLFALLTFGLYRLFGLAGAMVFTVTMWLAIAFALLFYMRGLVAKPANAVALAGLCLYAMQMATPRPWLFTILFFIVELGVLWNYRRTGRTRGLLLLPPIFMLWANIHIQFVYGLFVIGMVMAEPLLDRLFKQSPTVNTQVMKRLGIVLAACLLATLVNPYHVKIYWVIYELVTQTEHFRYVLELQSPDFRDQMSWLMLAAAVCAIFAIGWRREIKPLPVLMLLIGIYLAFRARRDAWFLCIIAVTIIASGGAAVKVGRDRLLSGKEWLAAAMIITMALFLVIKLRRVSADELRQVVADAFPEVAVKMIEGKGYDGPIYNHFNWGGYLIWRLPRLPVAMDGRTNVHGEDRVARSAATWSGYHKWSKDPELASARLVIGSVNDPLVSLLRLDHRFELVHEDRVAVVFIAHSQLVRDDGLKR